MKNKMLLISGIIFITTNIYSQKIDSLAYNELKFRIERIEGFETNIKEGLNIEFNKKSIKIEEDFKLLKKDYDSIIKDYDLIKKWGVIGGIIGGSFTLLTLIGIWVKGKKYIEEQIITKFDKIINENESNIIDLIKNQSKEMQIIKSKKILVITSKKGDDNFLRSFFKKIGFPIDNVKYIREDSYVENYIEGIDLIFANNEIGNLETKLIDEYFLNSNSKTVLFYFNTTRKNYTQNEVSNRLSFASTKPQIYGNIINLLKYQEVI